MEHGQINLAGDDLADTHRYQSGGTGDDFLRQGRGFCHRQSGLGPENLTTLAQRVISTCTSLQFVVPDLIRDPVPREPWIAGRSPQ